jgi:urea carboxylase
MPMFGKVLVANRGEIACRILRTLKRMNIASVAVYSDADRHSLHVAQADESVRIGGGKASESYLDRGTLLGAARATGAAAIHPGYGFLSENAEFAEQCAAAGIVFIGPTVAQMRSFGLKHLARDLAARNGVPLLPGSGLLGTALEARREAARIGYPIMLKSTAGGGGIGMQLVHGESELGGAFAAVERLATKNFSRGGAFLERYIGRARHIEVQIFGDGAGGVVALGERDCSTQRRHQKIIEETPAPGLPADVRSRLHESAVRLGKAVAYQSAGTVEYVYDTDSGEFFFLEVNTRLQVEHGVTEEVLGIDLVEWMVRQAAGEHLTLDTRAPRGVAIEARVYAEDPARDFRPSSGLVTRARFPADARIETWIADGTQVTPLYDPLLAKIITVGADREAALDRLRRALGATTIAGIETNLDYLRCLCTDLQFTAGGMTTRALDGFVFAPRRVEVVSGGTQTTIQDFPGRIGYWQWSGCRSPGNHRLRAHAQIRCRGDDLSRRRRHGRRLGRSPRALVDTRTGARRRGAAYRQSHRSGLPRLSRDSRRHRRARVPGQPHHLHTRKIRRTRRPGADGGRHAAHRQRRCLGRTLRHSDPVPARDRRRLGIGRAVRAAWRAGFFHRRGHRRLLRRTLGGALQLESYGRPSARAEADVGPQRWR